MSTERLLLTVETAPSGYEIDHVYTLIQYTKRVNVTNAGASGGECQEALDVLAASMPVEANALIGVRVTSTAMSLDDKVYLYLTYTGTPAVILPKT